MQGVGLAVSHGGEWQSGNHKVPGLIPALSIVAS